MIAGAQTTATRPVRGREVGAQISGVFGTVFVWVNSEALPPVVRVPLVLIALVALVAILVLSVRSYRRQRVRGARASDEFDVAPEPAAEGSPAGRSPFGRAYWIVVGVEAVALFGGSRLVTELGYPELGVAWVAVVVGTHFFALARVFRLARFHLLGAIVTALGLAGFALRLLGLIDAIALVSGAASGFVLLAFGLWALAGKRGAASRLKQETAPAVN